MSEPGLGGGRADPRLRRTACRVRLRGARVPCCAKRRLRAPISAGTPSAPARRCAAGASSGRGATAPALRGCEHRRDDTLPPSAERLASSVQRMAWRMPAAARGKMPAAPWLSLFARYRLLVT
ncbi:MAG: hypothetical protein ACK53J_07180, partial [Betaproteobacteria bacterium]